MKFPTLQYFHLITSCKLLLLIIITIIIIVVVINIFKISAIIVFLTTHVSSTFIIFVIYSLILV